MSVVICGIDEAGYGPLLGPLCVGLSVFRVDGWSPGDPSPDLWERLGGAVCRTPTEARARGGGLIPINDSKKLKLANSVKTKHPLVHLERGVLTALGCMGERPTTDGQLLLSLGAHLEDHPWYGGEERPIPLGSTRDQIAIATNLLNRALGAGGVEVLDVSCRVMGVERFNETIRRMGSKAEATLTLIGEHLRSVWEQWSGGGGEGGGEGGGGGGALRVVCDRLGGRLSYGRLLARELVHGGAGREKNPGACASGFGEGGVVTLEESARCSRYEVTVAGRMGRILLIPESEGRHLPVALASMTAKLVRELAMGRFNRYWGGRSPGLKPTAGYRADAARWLGDMGGRLTPAERAAMIRRA